MDISRLIFSKETKNKMKEELSGAQRGKLRWEKIKDAEDSGLLTRAKNRYEVANIVGYTEAERSTGYQWVSNMIRRGHIQEIALGLNNGKFEYEYHAVGEPDFDHSKARKAANKKLKATKTNKAKAIKRTKYNGKTGRERGVEMFKKLEKVSENGMLSKAKNRTDVARLIGYDKNRINSGYAWVSSLIYRGYLREHFVCMDDSGSSIMEYALGDSKPKYCKKETNVTKENVEEHKENEEGHEEVKNIEIEEKEVVNPNVIKISITRGYTNISVELVDCTQAIKLITTILKGEQNEQDVATAR